MRKTKLVGNLGMFLLIAAFGFSSTLCAQKKEQKKVVKVIKHGDADTAHVEKVMVYHIDEDDVNVNIDSIIKSHKGDIEKHMKVMAFKLDSLEEMDFDFKFDGDMEKMHIELERLMEEKGHLMEELKNIKVVNGGNMVFISEDGEHHTINIDEEIDGDVKRVKVITKTVCDEGEGGSERVESYIIKNGKRNDVNVWHSKGHMHKATVKFESIPVEDIAFLKEAGISAKSLMNAPLNVEDIKLKIEQVINDEVKQTIVHVECALSDEGPYQLEIIKKDSKPLIEKETIKGKTVEKEFEVKEEEAPYYFILSKNNQLFGRKIVL